MSCSELKFGSWYGMLMERTEAKSWKWRVNKYLNVNKEDNKMRSSLRIHINVGITCTELLQLESSHERDKE